MPGETSQARHCQVLWAQRKDVIFLTLDVEDCKDKDIQFTDDKLHFKGHGGPDGQAYEVELPFYENIDNENVREISTSRNIQFVIPKKEAGPFWPRLLKSTTKLHYLKVDFNKWKDEDDVSDEEAGGMGGMGGMGGGDLNDLMSKMGGGYGGMPGMGGMPDLGNFEDSDDDDMPDLEDGADGPGEEAATNGDSTGKKAGDGADEEEGKTKAGPGGDDETPVVDAAAATA